MWVEHRATAFDVFNYALLVAMSAAFLYPVVMTLAISFSDADRLGNAAVGVWPVGFSLDAYRLLLSDGRIVRYYLNTINYAGTGTLIMLLSTSMMAYPLTFRELRGGKLVAILLVISIFFSGGLVPFYLVVLRLRLVDTMWALVLPNAISAFNVMIFRTFFANIPSSLRESASIDGAGHFTVLWRIIIPLSKPLLATFALYTVVMFWNDFFQALIFLRDQDKQPIQLFLRRILVLLDFRDVENSAILQVVRNISSRTVKGAAVIITITPILCVYPFLQKYFTKGMMIGAIKA